MRRSRCPARAACLLFLLPALSCDRPAGSGSPATTAMRFEVSFPASAAEGSLDGRLLVMVSADTGAEPRFQISDGATTQLIFGMDVDGLAPGAGVTVDQTAYGFPLRSIAEIPAGTYRVQALLNRYETYHLATGQTVKLPPDHGEGQQWNTKPGNLYSSPVEVSIDPGGRAVIRLSMDKVIPPIPDPPDTKYVKHVRIQSRKLSEFYGAPIFIGAHVLLPEGFDTHPDAHYPLVINHGHFPADLGGWRPEPPDPDVPCEYSERFRLDCYNQIEQVAAHQFYEDWTGPGFPRVLVVEIQHPTPYYDDSYAVNSASQGPWGDAIMQELVPEIERRFRGIGQGYARFTYGGSTGGWEAMAVQMFYPDDFNGAWIACPDPIDFRAYTVVDIYQDTNAYFLTSRWKRTPRPGRRDWLGHIAVTNEESNHYELALGTHSRSGQQYDIWEATFSPQAADGYPARIYDKETGRIDPDVASYWRDNYDLSYILRRDWENGLGQKLKGKLHIYVGDMDNYYLNDAVYLVEDFLKSTTNPPYGGEVDYGDRAEHCWNGDQTRENAYSRLRYHQMFILRIMEQIRRNHPAGADTLSWRY
jgi:hypothetical protein